MNPSRAQGARLARLAVPVAALAIVLAACTGGASPSADAGASGEPPATASLEGTPWQLTEYVGAGGRAINVPATLVVTATFEGGRVTGSGGCNTYSGSYTVDGEALAISSLVATKMSCGGPRDEVESQYLQILGLVESYTIDGQTLALRNGSGTITLRYEVAEVPELTGTRWVATGINNGNGAVTSTVEGTKVTAIFGEDGRVVGSGGCNEYNGTYTVDGDAIDVGPLAATKKACVDAGVSEQETAFFAAMEAATTYAISGDELELRDAEGALQVSFRPTLP